VLEGGELLFREVVCRDIAHDALITSANGTKRTSHPQRQVNAYCVAGELGFPAGFGAELVVGPTWTVSPV
jgi:hypothetical protein